MVVKGPPRPRCWAAAASSAGAIQHQRRGCLLSRVGIHLIPQPHDLLLQAQNTPDALQADPRGGKRADFLQSLNVAGGIEPVAPLDSLRTHQALSLVLAQGLRMQLSEFGGDGNGVDGALIVHDQAFAASRSAARGSS